METTFSANKVAKLLAELRRYLEAMEQPEPDSVQCAQLLANLKTLERRYAQELGIVRSFRPIRPAAHVAP